MMRKHLAPLLALAAALVYLYPLAAVIMNSFKKKAYVSRAPFALPLGRMFAGFANYEKGVALTGFPEAFITSAVITVLSAALILLCTSMCAWYITRVRTKTTHMLYLLFIFSMVAPFQMVMFTLSKTATILHLNTPWSIPFIYLGFGAGLAVFLFTGFLKACPQAVEESAMIDGCNPLRAPRTMYILCYDSWR